MDPISPEQEQRNAEYDAMMDEIYEAYEQYFADEITIDELQQIEDAAFAAFYPEDADNTERSLATNQERREAVEQYKEDLNDPMTRSSISIEPFSLGDYQKVYLPMPYEAQITGWYCGPAAAVNVINGYQGYTYASQSWAAQQLGTTGNGTNFGTNWLNVLNTSTMGKSYAVGYGSYDWARELADKTIGTFLSGRGVVLNLYMNGSTIYLPGYDSSMGTVGHYVAGYGFDSSDPSRRLIHYLDPNGDNSTAWGAHTVTYQDMDMATYQRGIIY